MVQLAIWNAKVQENPQDLNARRNYAMSLLANGAIGEAATEAKNILKAYPEDATVRFTYARALQLQGYEEDALREFSKTVQMEGPKPVLERAKARAEELQAKLGVGSGR